MSESPRPVPPVVQAWIGQLLDEQFLTMLAAMPVERIDVRLSASGTKVRRPVVVLNGGPSELAGS